MTVIWAMTFLVLSVGISYSYSAEDKAAVPFCDLLSAPQNYDKTVVVTRAIIHSTYHTVHVSDEKCKSTLGDDRSASLEFPEGWNSTKLGKKLSEILGHHRSGIVTFEGVFYGSGGPFGQEGTRFRFLLKRLLSVEKLPKNKNGHGLATSKFGIFSGSGRMQSSFSSH